MQLPRLSKRRCGGCTDLFSHNGNSLVYKMMSNFAYMHANLAWYNSMIKLDFNIDLCQAKKTGNKDLSALH